MYQKLQHLQPALVNRKPQISMTMPDPQVAQPKVEQTGLQRFASSTIFIYLSPTNYHLFRHLNDFLHGRHCHNQKKAEDAFQPFVESQSMNFYGTRINKLTSLWQSVLIVIVPILINKDVCELSYNDLKFMVQNCNYICTNLITTFSEAYWKLQTSLMSGFPSSLLRLFTGQGVRT